MYPHRGDQLALDLETIAGDPIRPRGGTGVTIAPGIVYSTGPIALGGRLGRDIGAGANCSSRPLDVVFHTGIGF